MPNRIRVMEKSHRILTVSAFRQFKDDKRVGVIAVTMDPLDVPLHGNDRDLIVTPPKSNEVLTLQYIFLLDVIVENHRYEAILELRKCPIPV